jgi:hypothetical protein
MLVCYRSFLGLGLGGGQSFLLAYAEWVNVAKGGGQSFFLAYAQWVNVAKLSLTAEIFEGRRLQDCH